MDEQVLNTNEALKILKKHYITDDIQMVTRFIRSERLKAEKDTRKNGYRIRESDLYDFIEEEKPGMVEVMYIYEKYIEQLTVNSNPEKYIKAVLAIKNVVDKQDEPYLQGSEEDSTRETETSVIAQADADQKINQAASMVSDQIQTELSEDLIDKFLEHPSFQSALSEIEKQITSKLKGDSSNRVRSNLTRKKSPGKHKYQSQTLEEFLKMLTEHRTGKKILGLYSSEQLAYLYNLYYENGEMKAGLYNKEEEPPVYICPVSKKKRNQWLHLLAATYSNIVEHMEKVKTPENMPNPDERINVNGIGHTSTEGENEKTKHVPEEDSAVPSDRESPDTPDEDEKDYEINESSE